MIDHHDGHGQLTRDLHPEQILARYERATEIMQALGLDRRPTPNIPRPQTHTTPDAERLRQLIYRTLTHEWRRPKAIAKQVGRHVDTVSDALHFLVRRGVVEVLWQKGQGVRGKGIKSFRRKQGQA